ncbi:hypothetical protein ACU5AX_19350 [Sphingomonas sp. XXL09]|uniref:hypothetical protein n=1 Tax=Sphingomonas sp. XXL09 TaxID=3457787 RepID=UPI00406BD05E
MSITAGALANYVVASHVGLNVLANSHYRFTTADAYRSFAALTEMPELAAWLQIILGFGLIGGALRYRRRQTAVCFAAAGFEPVGSASPCALPIPLYDQWPTEGRCGLLNRLYGR